GNLEMEKGRAKETLFFCLDIRTNISLYKIQNGSGCIAPGTILSTVWSRLWAAFLFSKALTH
ncbi:hypothetical protein, partial [Enterocloster citroniae]|uniref:hypothetical protein n=1 Tax=Enterocloster citroniae TaxID=358743 RepID=UPI001A9B2789